jgi:hypothetical protein
VILIPNNGDQGAVEGLLVDCRLWPMSESVVECFGWWAAGDTRARRLTGLSALMRGEMQKLRTPDKAGFKVRFAASQMVFCSYLESAPVSQSPRVRGRQCFKKATFVLGQRSLQGGSRSKRVKKLWARGTMQKIVRTEQWAADVDMPLLGGGLAGTVCVCQGLLV